MALIPHISQYLRADEEAQIHVQFQGETWRGNRQVLWSGILREEAQQWADKHEMQTLTTAMGPLMDPSHPLCLRSQKSSDAWSKYIKGASAIFAYYISKGESVTVLSPPPPDRFHPSGQTNYQAIEEPIVKGGLGIGAVSRIEMVHPIVKEAEGFFYQLWPEDSTSTWMARFGELKTQKRHWRTVKAVTALSNRLGAMAIANDKKAKQETKVEEVKKKRAKKARKAQKKAEQKAQTKAKEAISKANKQVWAKEKTVAAKKERRKAKKERRKVKKETKRAKKKAMKLANEAKNDS